MPSESENTRSAATRPWSRLNSKRRRKQRTAALRRIFDLAVGQRVDWMHFHELAMADPFKAEAEALAFCREIQQVLADVGITHGREWRTHGV